ncbi:MAG: ferrous iron transport protein B [Proteobacteria bacterium]|nr:ferrous iron transport protein B [Pseudomonadota bacterium]
MVGTSSIANAKLLDSHLGNSAPDKADRVRVALAGNPNCGKTTIFNALTGARQHVGNYAGVTVEKREGGYSFESTEVELLDLPGTYSLSYFSPEERIAQDEILRDDLDAVVVVIDSATLKRSLVLLAQVIQTGARPVLCLNMTDEAEKSGQRIDVALLESLLGIPVVKTTGHKQIGIDKLKRAVSNAISAPVVENRVVLGRRLIGALSEIIQELTKTNMPSPATTWAAMKLLLGDKLYVNSAELMGEHGKQAVKIAESQRSWIEKETGTDISLYVMEQYYGFVDGLLMETITERAHVDTRVVSDWIDSIVVNRMAGIPIFLAVMYSIFWFTFTLGEYPMGWIESGFESLGTWLSSLWPEGSESAVRSLIVDGIIGGVGGVIVFLPNIVILFLGLAFLEDTGYLARAAFLTDRLMHRFGLHGKSFIPLVIGFGCSIPGIMATRTMENERDRLSTMLVLPLMSCGARLPIWMLLIPAFFAEQWRAPALWGIYMTGIVLALVLSLLLRKTVLKGEEAPFVMELPPYRLPTIRAVMTRMVERSWLYLRKAGTIILGISILMWVMTSYPKSDSYQVDEEIAPAKTQLTEQELEHRRAADDLENSIAGRIGRFIEPALRPLGFDWKIGVGMLGALAAKEVFVSQMGIIYSMGETDEESMSLRDALARDYSALVGFSLMLFLLISAPCMATIAVTRRESGSWKWAALQLGGLTAIAYVISLLFFQIGQLFI